MFSQVYGISAHHLVVEVTESAIMRDFERARHALDCLRSAGIGIYVDDFGTGQSSLAYLKSLPLDELKIDRSFVKDMLTDTQDEAIVRSDIELGHRLGLQGFWIEFRAASLGLWRQSLGSRNLEEVVPGGADGDCCIGKSLWTQFGQPPTAIPTSQFLENDLFHVVGDSGVAQSRQHCGQLRDELLSIILVDPDWVELEQDLEQLVVQGTVLNLVAFPRRPTLLVVARADSFVHPVDEPYRRLAVIDSRLVQKGTAPHWSSVGQQHAFAQQIEASSPEHLSFGDLDLIHVSFHGSRTPALGQSRVDGIPIVLQVATEAA
jgi:hypothetical protein